MKQVQDANNNDGFNLDDNGKPFLKPGSFVRSTLVGIPWSGSIGSSYNNAAETGDL
ncbi:hypothetical protein [Xylocopilactobacillus apis]|uniref:hypothetical protein n=1 Tax=Xylocopilactobacillus apis TaxID=2932183 RepID=UPI0029552179|nr:hypothetical protein [Xylocopilactobacillus apis]